MEGWPSINAPRDWAPHPCPFTGPGREGCCQKPRHGAIDPATFPSCGWQLQCQWAWGRHAALPRRKDSQQLYLCGGRRESHWWSACECQIHVNKPRKKLLVLMIAWPEYLHSKTTLDHSCQMCYYVADELRSVFILKRFLIHSFICLFHYFLFVCLFVCLLPPSPQPVHAAVWQKIHKYPQYPPRSTMKRSFLWFDYLFICSYSFFLYVNIWIYNCGFLTQSWIQSWDGQSSSIAISSSCKNAQCSLRLVLNLHSIM